MLLLVSFACLLGGCNSLTQPKGKDLHGIVKRFHHDLRWRYNEDVCARVDPEHSADYREKLEDLDKDLNITAWSVRKVEVNEEIGEARLRINLRYYLMPSTVIKNERVKEIWKLVEGEQWMMVHMDGGPVPFPPEMPEDEDEQKKKDAPAKETPTLETSVPRDLPDESTDE